MKKLILLIMTFILLSCNNDDDYCVSNVELAKNVQINNNYLLRESKDYFNYLANIENHNNKKVKFYITVTMVSDDPFFNNNVSFKTDEYWIEKNSKLSINYTYYYLTLNRLNYSIVDAKIIVTDRY